MDGEKAPRTKWDGEESEAKREFIDGALKSSPETGLFRDEEQCHASLSLTPS